jgi:hypothetical protein
MQQDFVFAALFSIQNPFIKNSDVVIGMSALSCSVAHVSIIISILRQVMNDN